MGPPKLIDAEHSNVKALVGAGPGMKCGRPGVSPFISPGRDPTVVGLETMPAARMPTDKAVAERYRARMTELKEQRANSVAVPARRQHAVKVWLIDTGCGHDLVAKA
eukprot:1595136-Alexandrium_andersonii.AAC.1